MKKCFLEFIERFTWDNDGNEYILFNQQRECMNCHYFQRCYALSLGRTVGRILVQLEMMNHLPEEEDNNGHCDIINVESPFEED